MLPLRPLPQYYEAPPALADILAYMNLIFTMLFSLECILKLAAFGIKVHSYSLRLSPFTLGSLSYHHHQQPQLYYTATLITIIIIIIIYTNYFPDLFSHILVSRLLLGGNCFPPSSSCWLFIIDEYYTNTIIVDDCRLRLRKLLSFSSSISMGDRAHNINWWQTLTWTLTRHRFIIRLIHWPR